MDPIKCAVFDYELRFDGLDVVRLVQCGEEDIIVMSLDQIPLLISQLQSLYEAAKSED